VAQIISFKCTDFGLTCKEYLDRQNM